MAILGEKLREMPILEDSKKVGLTLPALNQKQGFEICS
jgi:hypothetical protein